MIKFEADIKICKEAIHTKLWRKDKDQLAKWRKFLLNLSELHKIKTPKLFIKNIEYPETDGGIINLNRFSVISLLHEFGHCIGLTHKGKVNCWNYSEKVFFGAYPKAKTYLKRDKGGYWRKQ